MLARQRHSAYIADDHRGGRGGGSGRSIGQRPDQVGRNDGRADAPFDAPVNDLTRLAAMTVVLKRCSTNARAAAPMACLVVASHSCTIASRHAWTSPGGSSKPVCPAAIVSGMPPMSLPSTGTPAACASTETRPKVSGAIDGNASIDIAL